MARFTGADGPSEQPATTSRRGWKVGAVAAVSTAAIGASVLAPVGEADASLVGGTGIDVDLSDLASLSPSALLGKVVGGTLNNDVAQAIAEQWRLQVCGTGGVSANDDTTAVADCERSTGTGVAIVAPGSIEVVPVGLYDMSQVVWGWISWLTGSTLPDAELPYGTATVIGDGFQFAFAQTGGSATAISYLPLSLATAGAGNGRTALSFALIGVANAWTTDDTPLEVFGNELGKIPGVKSTSCFGMLTAAYAEDVGACLNVLGTFDAKLDLTDSIPELQLGLTNPAGVITDPDDVLTELVTGIFSGSGLNPATLFTSDIARLSLGGENLLAGTSDYGFTQLGGEGGAIVVDWMGQKLVLLPTVRVNGKTTVNYLGLPQVTFGDLDLSSIVPTFRTGAFELPFVGDLDGVDTGDLLGGATATSATAGDAPQARTLSVVNEAPADLPEIEVNDAAPLPEIEYNTGNDDAAETADGADDDVPVLDSTAQTGGEAGDQDGGADTELATDIGGTGSSDTDAGSGAQGGSESDAGQTADTGTGTGTGSTAGTTADDSSAELVGAAG